MSALGSEITTLVFVACIGPWVDKQEDRDSKETVSHRLTVVIEGGDLGD